MNFRITRSPWAPVFVLSLSFSSWAYGDGPAPVVATQVLSTTQTSSGQPIVLPKSDAQVVVTMLEIQPGAKLPEHLHPSPRYGYMMAGTLKVTNDSTGQAQTFQQGDFIVESLGQWHHAESIGSVPVKLLVIDQVDPKKPDNVVLKK